MTVTTQLASQEKQNNPKEIYLKDYKVPEFLIEKTDLLVQIFEDRTTITTNLDIKRNPASDNQSADLVLDGTELKTVSVSVSGIEQIEAQDYVIVGEQMTLKNVPDTFRLLTVVEIKPDQNTSLEGLYQSNGMFCTQCEAQGFRKITWYMDRPDVMSKFTTRVEADKNTYPILLSNGNATAQGDLMDGRHFVTWKDPFAKPCYLFALVAGKLVCAADVFTTMTGKEIRLELFVEAHNANKTRFALDALKRSMTWDEERFGREYDLDIYMIVAVDHFNMGAMENKGLNVFNSACVLADEQTTTDAGFERIEAIIGHEYFHNWSGNRVTCRDWFQLSLKEGFTVFRDSEFTADLHSRPVKRIADVNFLKTHQFTEDAGPMAHAIRPASYMEINNFYTLTVYEKGAEVVGMLRTLLGNELFRKGSDLYFDTFDGQAVTTEDFVACMAKVSGLDLSQFQVWYEQASTPDVNVTDQFDAETGVYSLTFEQSCKASAECKHKKPYMIPVKLGLIDAEGNDLELTSSDTAFNKDTSVFTLTAKAQTLEFTGLTAKPLPSLFRDFSAPINLKFDYSPEQLAFLLAHDSNSFNRWQAGQTLMLNLIETDVDDLVSGNGLSAFSIEAIEAVFTKILADDRLDAAMKAMLLTLPSEATIAAHTASKPPYAAEGEKELLAHKINPIEIAAVHKSIVKQLAKSLAPQWKALFEANQSEQEYKFEFSQVAQRSLKNLALSYWVESGDKTAMDAAKNIYHTALNHTDRSAAMNVLVNNADTALKQSIIDDFYQMWSSDTQMVEQWLAMQASASNANAETIKTLMQHPAFEMGNPNKIRSVVGGFSARNAKNFHHVDGRGYELLADIVIELNVKNPQIASRLVTPLTQWARYNEHCAEKMKAALTRIKAEKDLSPDLFEVVSKSL
jgi:aminopeptidase N